MAFRHQSHLQKWALLSPPSCTNQETEPGPGCQPRLSRPGVPVLAAAPCPPAEAQSSQRAPGSRSPASGGMCLLGQPRGVHGQEQSLQILGSCRQAAEMLGGHPPSPGPSWNHSLPRASVSSLIKWVTLPYLAGRSKHYPRGGAWHTEGAQCTPTPSPLPCSDDSQSRKARFAAGCLLPGQVLATVWGKTPGSGQIGGWQ